MQQTTNTIFMVRPVSFRMNEQTAVNNYFQEDLNLKNAEINKKAQEEFDAFVAKLKNSGINVIVENDDEFADTPDSVFPNNWVSFHENGDVVIYPMFAENRRKERRDEVFLRLEQEGFVINNIIDYTSAEDELETLSLYKLLKVFSKMMERYEYEQNKPVHKVVKYPYTIENQKSVIKTLIKKRPQLCRGVQFFL